MIFKEALAMRCPRRKLKTLVEQRARARARYTCISNAPSGQLTEASCLKGYTEEGVAYRLPEGNFRRVTDA